MLISCDMGINKFEKAINNGNITSVEQLLKDGKIKINEKINSKNYPIELAIRNGNPKLIETLIEYGAEVNNINDECFPLIEAVRSNNLKTVKLFVKNDADLKIMDNTGKNLFFFSKDISINKYLLENNIDINQVDNNGVYSFTSSIKNCDLEMIKFFITTNAEMYKKDSENKNSFDYAEATKSDEVVSLFESKKKADSVWPKAGDIAFATVKSKYGRSTIVVTAKVKIIKRYNKDKIEAESIENSFDVSLFERYTPLGSFNKGTTFTNKETEFYKTEKECKNDFWKKGYESGRKIYN